MKNFWIFTTGLMVGIYLGAFLQCCTDNEDDLKKNYSDNDDDLEIIDPDIANEKEEV